MSWTQGFSQDTLNRTVMPFEDLVDMYRAVAAGKGLREPILIRYWEGNDFGWPMVWLRFEEI